MNAIGLTKKEIQKYSLLRAIYAAYTRDWSAAGFEAECSVAAYRRINKAGGGPHAFMVPDEWVVGNREQRDLTAASSSGGGYAVGTENVGFAEMLRARSVLESLGATVLSDLTANVTIPRQVSGATGYWLATESTQVTESQPVFGQLALTPKTVGAYTEISHQLLMQSSPSMEALVKRDLATVAALAADAAGINGSGSSGQPTGLLNASGIGSVTGGSLAYAGVVEFQTDVANSNALSASCAYLSTPTVAGVLKGRQRFTNTDTPLWQGNLFEGEVEGFRAMSSNQVPSGTLIFGDWQHVILAHFGRLELDVNPYANFQAGIVGVRVLFSMDVAVRYPGAFSVATGVN